MSRQSDKSSSREREEAEAEAEAEAGKRTIVLDNKFNGRGNAGSDEIAPVFSQNSHHCCPGPYRRTAFAACCYGATTCSSRRAGTRTCSSEATRDEICSRAQT